jgi:transposase
VPVHGTDRAAVKERCLMIVIGIDPHKHSHTAVAIDEREQVLAQLTVVAGPSCALRLLEWAATWPTRRWAIEGARGLGYHLAQQLAAAGEQVADVNAKLAARARLLDRGHGRKSDQADARSVALVALRAHRLPPVACEDDIASVLRLLADRRDELNQERRRVTNRLHRLLRDLLAGGAPTPLTASRAALLLRRVAPVTAADQQRKALAGDLVGDLRRLDRQLVANRTRCQELLKLRPTRLIQIFGISAVLATKLIGHSGPITRFVGPDHYASYTGTAPVDASSGPNTRQRVNHGGNRALNTAIHLVARTQISRPGPGRAYYDRKLAEGKTPNQAFRALKRQIVKVVYRALLADHHAAHPQPEPATA